MGQEGTGTPGRTLGFASSGEGSADLRPRLDGYTLRRTVMAAAAIGAFVAGVAAGSAVLEGEVDPGVVVDPAGSRIDSVVVAGPAWQTGIRPGQAIVTLLPADAPSGGRIETTDGLGIHLYDSSTATAALSASWPLAAGALAAGALALLFLRSRRRWALPAASIAFLLAGQPLLVSGSLTLATSDLAAAVAVPWAWAAWRVPGGRLTRSATVGILVAFLGAWLYARSAALPQAGSLDWVRTNVAAWGTAALVLDRALALRAGERVLLIRPRPFDVAALAVVAGGSVALVTLLALPPLAVAAVAAIAVISIPGLRRRLRPVENALLADVRAQAAAEATEQERGRLARELHDVPLQELFGVIRRLEIKPGTEAESDDLRALASHLRNVAIELRPPVLEDLGLPAALEYLAEGAASPKRPVVAQVTDLAGIDRAQRPPEPVELAMFRIAMEAVANAVAHSGSTSVRISATVSTRRVELRVIDDGKGLDPGAAKTAARDKHMGLNSMRRRADAIDADFAIHSDAQGTIVEAVWQA